MQNILNIVQISISILLTVTILLQQRGGGGLGSAFGGGGGGNAYTAKRGLEKLLFRASIALAILFLVSAFLRLIF
ncbi:preprotein translocase subunit SecG [bacterium]|nr:preprotein translocase subunit SecG [bacterium]|tara:strand:- start:6135 stop:6359 length:225 start_codon:yes stop_codon:yes gene_type:complete